MDIGSQVRDGTAVFVVKKKYPLQTVNNIQPDENYNVTVTDITGKSGSTNAVTHISTQATNTVSVPLVSAQLTSTVSDDVGTSSSAIVSAGRQDSYGLVTVVGASGATIIGSGEVVNAIREDLSIVGNPENVNLVADNAVVMRVNCDSGYSGGTQLTFDENSAYVTSHYTSGTTWYRVWSDGWIEQGGTINVVEVKSTTVTLPKAMKDANYTALVVNGSGKTSSNAEGLMTTASLTTTSFAITCGYIDPNTSLARWVVMGQGA